MTEPEILTTASGIPVADNQNSLTAGPRGPRFMQGFHLITKIAHFNPETTQNFPTLCGASWSLSPWSLHQVTILFSARGPPKNYRHMDGFSSHTFSLINSRNERVWVKFHLKTKQGNQNLTREEAVTLAGENPDYATQDLFEAIERGEYPKWRLCVQIMPESESETYHLNPFDLTKVWPHSEYPLIEVGELELNRTPENYFAEVEQATFPPANVVAGISFSPDKMLQARVLSYTDAHRYRLGVNYESLPVNRAKCPVNDSHRDGSMRFDANGGSTPNYEPNSFGGPKQDPDYAEPPLGISGDASRYDHRAGNDDYKQAGDLFRLMTAEERARLIDNIVDSMKSVPREIQSRQIAHFYQADPAYGEGVEAGLKTGERMPIGCSDCRFGVEHEDHDSDNATHDDSEQDLHSNAENVGILSGHRLRG